MIHVDEDTAPARSDLRSNGGTQAGAGGEPATSGRTRCLTSRWNGSPLWLVRRLDDDDWNVFAGTFEQAISHINQLHRETGKLHAARELWDVGVGHCRD